MKNLIFIPIKKLKKKKYKNFGLNFFNFKKILEKKKIIKINLSHLEAYKHSRILEKKLSNFLFLELNKLHSVNFTYRQWYIILGYWLRRFSNVVFYRYYLVDQIFKRYNFKSFTFYLNHQDIICNKNSYSFIKSTNDLKWNDILFNKIVQLKAEFSKKKFNFNYYSKRKYILQNFYPYSNQRIILKILDNFLSLFIKSQDNLIKINKISYFESLKLNIKFKQIFRFNIFPDENILDKTNYEKRKKLIKNIKLKNFSPFEISKKLIFQYLPETYFENFDSNLKLAKKINFPQNPKKIVTDNDFDTNEIFKLWTALKTKGKSKYYILQHGNNYGTSIHTIDNPEQIACDKFFSWGWKDNKKVSKGVNYQIKKNKSIPYTDDYYLYLDAKLDLDFAFNNNEAWEKYIQSHLNFLDNLENKNKLKIIPHPYYSNKSNLSDYGELLKYKDFFSTLDYNKSPKLAIYGYESTGFLNRISYNMPTISFYNLKNSNLRKNAIKNYMKLVSANFLFISPLEAANFLNNKNFEINRWWFNKKSQTKLNNFKKIYTRVSNNNLEELFRFISK